MEFINFKETASILDIPELAIGQLMFDGKLIPKDGFCFDKHDVENLKKENKEYLNKLK